MNLINEFNLLLIILIITYFDMKWLSRNETYSIM